MARPVVRVVVDGMSWCVRVSLLAVSFVFAGFCLMCVGMVGGRRDG